MKNLKSSQWLYENLENENIIILDARAVLDDPMEGFKEYKESHIPGARYVPLEEVMTGELSTHGGRHPLPELNEFATNMINLGIDDDSTIVIYDHGNLAMAGRLWWIFKYFSKDKVYILKDGMEGWKNNKYPVTDKLPEIQVGSSLNLVKNKSILADVEDVRKAIESEDTAIMDARAFERYSGEVEPLDKIAGHIPTAINYPWMELINKIDNESLESLKEYFNELDKYKEIIVHCGSGVTGTVNFLFMEEIGLQPKLYAGGYSDWVSYEENHVIEKT